MVKIMNLVSITIRTVIFYFFIVFSYRIMGKREIGQLGVADLTVSILIAELIAISIENIDGSMLNSIVPVSVLVLLEIGVAYLSVKNKTIRTIFDGRPSLIISNGIVNYSEMTKLRYSIDDLLVALRQAGIKSIEEIEYALLEANGRLSIFPYNMLRIKSDYPLPLIIDGKIQKDTLKHIKKNREWLDRVISNKGLRLEDIFYAFYKKKKIFIIRN